jgi:hypothetical protein
MVTAHDERIPRRSRQGPGVGLLLGIEFTCDAASLPSPSLTSRSQPLPHRRVVAPRVIHGLARAQALGPQLDDASDGRSYSQGCARLAARPVPVRG